MEDESDKKRTQNDFSFLSSDAGITKREDRRRSD